MLVYFGSFQGEHQWWPIMLYPLIWPWSLFYETLQSHLCDWLIPDPKTASAATWLIIDGVGGAFYIIAGTLWVWFLGKMVSLGVTRIFGKKQIEPNNTPDDICQPVAGSPKSSV